MKPLVTRVMAEDGLIEPAPRQPRWIAYGDSIAEGWIASSPAASWVATAGRRYGFDVVNMGYAGAARGEIVSAEQIASREADVISLTHGTNCWSMVPYSTDMMRSTTEAFLRVVRAGHPGVPLVVASPLVRPDAEDRPNRLGATQADLRRAMEEAVRAVGDDRTTLVPGRDVLAPEMLGDGVHPDDGGHRVLVEVFGDAVRSAYRLGRLLGPLTRCTPRAVAGRNASKLAGRGPPAAAAGGDEARITDALAERRHSLSR